MIWPFRKRVERPVYDRYGEIGSPARASCIAFHLARERHGHASPEAIEMAFLAAEDGTLGQWPLGSGFAGHATMMAALWRRLPATPGGDWR